MQVADATSGQSISGRDLRALRQSLDLTQVAVARQLGTVRQFVGKIERTRRPTPRVVQRYLLAVVDLAWR